MDDLTKSQVEAAVNCVSKALGSLFDAIVNNANNISDEDSESIFNFLRNSLDILEDQADTRRSIAAVTTGTFSFDRPQPSLNKKNTNYNTRAGAPEPTVAIPTKREGRVSAHSPDLHPELPTAPIFPSSPSEPITSDITFLEDND
jgi:hypothetical protein